MGPYAPCQEASFSEPEDRKIRDLFTRGEMDSKPIPRVPHPPPPLLFLVFVSFPPWVIDNKDSILLSREHVNSTVLESQLLYRRFSFPRGVVIREEKQKKKKRSRLTKKGSTQTNNRVLI